MVRPSRNTDQRLVQAARDLLPETGFSGLKLRKVAEKAGVNLGMFNYHFKNKQEFVRRVMQETYEEFYEKFSLEVADSSEAPEQQLRKAVLTGARFLRENRQMILSLARDAMDGDPEIVRFLEKNFHRHLAILIRLMRKCKKQGVFGDWPLPVAVVLLAGSVLAPSMMVAVVERIRFHTPVEIVKNLLLPKVLSEKAIEARLDLALFALSGGRWSLPPVSAFGDLEALFNKVISSGGLLKEDASSSPKQKARRP